MAAFTGTPASSVQYALQVGNPSLKPFSADVWGVVRMAKFSYTHAAGAGTGEVQLVKLPAGRINIFSDLSRHICTQMAANADLHLGFRAYTEPDGDVVAEDDNAFLDNADSGGGALDAAWVLPALGITAFDVAKSTSVTSGAHSGGGLHIYAMVDTGNIEDTDTLDGWVLFST